MNQTPIERLAELQLTNYRLIMNTIIGSVPPEDRAEMQAEVDRALDTNAAAFVQNYADHLRLALTEEQAAEVLVYVEREKPACWDRYETALRLGATAANRILGVK